jgi:hypothetical protein
MFYGVKKLVNKAVWASAIIIIIIVAAASTYYYYASTLPNPTPSPSPSPTTTPTSTPTSTSQPSPTPSTTPPATTTDLNWGGYTAASDFNNPQPVITGVSGSWTVPQVTVSQNNTFSAVWVGIGGTFGNTLIQTGTEQDCINGVPTYSAWYELLPNLATTIQTMTISPGDHITASITLTDSTLNVWTISISDQTNGQSFTQTFLYDSTRLSAEWVVERPLVNKALSQLADFGSITFTNCNMEANNKSENLGNLTLTKILLSNSKKIQLVEVSNISSDGASFTIKYLLTQ